MRRRSSATGLAMVAAALVVLAGPSPNAGAQTSPADAFGGFQVSGRANGIQFTYDSPGLLPVSPVVQVSMPEALATLSNGPSGYAIGSVAFPGPLVADLGDALAQGGTDAPIPSYPVRSEAFYPSGPTEAQQELAPGASSHAVTTEGLSIARAQYTGADLPGFFNAGGITGQALTTIEDGHVVARARSEVSELDLLYGLVHIQSVVTDIVGITDGTTSASDGRTEVSGVTVLGQPATIDSAGIHFDEPPAGTPSTAAPGPLDPITGNLPPLGGTLDPLLSGAAALNGLAQQLFGTGGDALNQLLNQGGITIRTLDPVEAVSGGSVSRNVGGLVVEMTYDGETAPVFSQILAAVPSDQLPSDALVPGAPSSPQALFNLLKETHITTYSVGSAGLAAVASPAFVPLPLSPPSITSSLPGSTPSVAPFGGGGFSTGTPSLGSGGTAGTASTEGSSPISLLGKAMPTWIAMVLLVGAPVFGAASRRLADNVLSEGAAGGCPEGKT